ncbi:hypothetical protein LXA43DRAFT_1116114 [Ganoderma leucocontextum]|nr:hypothetical protein LXA43DRAFT_1116114 [Ganoderma leucocontextum]
MTARTTVRSTAIVPMYMELLHSTALPLVHQKPRESDGKAKSSDLINVDADGEEVDADAKADADADEAEADGDADPEADTDTEPLHVVDANDATDEEWLKRFLVGSDVAREPQVVRFPPPHTHFGDETQAPRQATGSLWPPSSLMDHSVVRIEEATAHRRSVATDDEKDRALVLVLSLSRFSKVPALRPSVIDNSDGDVMLSRLNAATNDLASLINRLDLETTPGSTDTILLSSNAQVPLKIGLRESTASASLRPYAKAQSSATSPKLSVEPAKTESKVSGLVGQQIAPWNELDWKVSPRKPLIKPKLASHLTHKRTVTPLPAETLPMFQPLRPANIKSKASLLVSESNSHSATPVTTEMSSVLPHVRFASIPGRSQVAQAHVQPCRPAPSMGMPLTAEACKGFGLCGTLGSSTEEANLEDPDSDIPDELQLPPSPGPPPKAALPAPEERTQSPIEQVSEAPVFQAQLFDIDANQAELDDSEHSPTFHSEDDSKKSFDFMDCGSFVEQLETAFKTPARMDLGFDFTDDSVLAPPVPPLPQKLRPAPVEDVPKSFSNFNETASMYGGSDETGNPRGPMPHSRANSKSSMVEEDSSVLKSIMAKAADILPADESRSRVDPSFTGFNSFDRVRRGFEFGPNRPAVYPPPQVVVHPQHDHDMSLFSIVSVSSYSAVVNNGTQDPFGYTQEGPSRPPSMDDMSISMSMSVDDTFLFFRLDKPRRRVDSGS